MIRITLAFGLNLLLTAGIMISPSVAQNLELVSRYRSDLKGNASSRKEGVLNGNRVQTIFANDGQICHWPYQPSGIWPKGSGHSYLDGYALLIGAKVIAPGNGIAITPIECAYRTQVDVDPITGESWVLRPIPGYLNSEATTPAMSSSSASWPATWPVALGMSADVDGKWNGFYGPGVRIGLNETFYVMDDSQDKEFTRAPFNYFPISSDSSRGGLGLRVEVRGMQWSEQSVENTLVWQYSITNISDRDYDTSSVGLYLDPAVGGTSNTGNSARVDPNLDLAYCWTPSGLGVPGNWKAGYMGFAALHTPSELGLTATSVFTIADYGPTSVWPKNDSVVWQKMNNGFADTLLTNTNIYMIIASGSFKMTRGVPDTLTTAILFAGDIDSLLLTQASIANHFRSGFTDLITPLLVVPTAPNLISPLPYTQLGSDSIHYTWNSSSPIVSSYEIALAYDSAFAAPRSSYSANDTSFTSPPLPAGTYWWRVRGWNIVGPGEYSTSRSFQVGSTDVENASLLLQASELLNCYPNPFNPSTIIPITLNRRDHLVLKVFNLLGEEVAELVNTALDAGTYRFQFSGQHLASGLYLAYMQTSTGIQAKSMILKK